MTASCLRQTVLPGTSRLFADYLYDFGAVRRFYAGDPWRSESVREAAAAIAYPDARRAALVSALRKMNGPSQALDLLELPETVAVVTGQQAGLFSGPAYTVYKALTAAKLAVRLGEQGIPAVPVFWMATQDHDFEEVRHAWVYDTGHNPVQASLPEFEGPPSAVGADRLRDIPLEGLRAAIGDAPYGSEVLSLVEESYVPGATLGTAMFELLRRLLSGHGMVFLDALQPELRELAAPLLEDAVGAAPDLLMEVLERNRQLEQAGYHAQVHVDADSSFFFLLGADNRRQALRRRGADYVAGGRTLTLDELKARAAEISPNALLRPVVQDYLLPTVVYVGGPSEIAYLAQSQPLYKRLLGRAPLALPRAGFTLLEGRTRKLLERYKLSPENCFTGIDVLGERMAGALVPDGVKSLFPNLEDAFEGMFGAIRHDLLVFDPTLAKALEKSGRKIRHQIGKMEAKVAREAFRRTERAASDTAYLANTLFPHKHPQERFYTILPFLADHGLSLLDRVYENIHLDCPDHVMLAL